MTRTAARRCLGGGLMALSLSACGQPAPAAAPSAPTREVQEKRLGARLPLKDYLPAPGLRFLLEIQPRRLLQDSALRQDWLPLLSTERLAVYAHASGIEPSKVERAFVAGYALGSLVLLDGREVGDAVETSFLGRALTSRRVETEASDLTFVTGMVEQSPHAVVHLKGHMVAIAEGDVGAARIVAAYADGKLETVPPALSGEALSVHRSFAPEAPLRIFFVGPFESSTDVVVQSTLDGVVSVVPEDGTLKVRAQVRGAYPPLDDLSERLTAWLLDLSQTREMRALGWSEFERAPTVSCAAPGEEGALRTCEAEATWNSRAIAHALYRLVAAESGELLDGAKSAEPTPGE